MVLALLFSRSLMNKPFLQPKQKLKLKTFLIFWRKKFPKKDETETREKTVGTFKTDFK
jgi:hypothetical protein